MNQPYAIVNIDAATNEAIVSRTSTTTSNETITAELYFTKKSVLQLIIQPSHSAKHGQATCTRMVGVESATFFVVGLG